MARPERPALQGPKPSQAPSPEPQGQGDLWLERVNKAVAIVAIVVGGIWFLATREYAPHAKITQTFSKTITGSKTVLHVFVTFTNVGKVPLNLYYQKTEIYSVVPLARSAAVTNPNGKGEILQWNEPPLTYQCATWTPKETFLSGIKNLFSCDGGPKPNPRHCCDQGSPMWMEVGESDFMEWNFLVPPETRKVRVYSYIQNESEKGLGWEDVSFYDLASGKTVDPYSGDSSSKEEK